MVWGHDELEGDSQENARHEPKYSHAFERHIFFPWRHMKYALYIRAHSHRDVED